MISSFGVDHGVEVSKGAVGALPKFATRGPQKLTQRNFNGVGKPTTLSLKKLKR